MLESARTRSRSGKDGGLPNEHAVFTEYGNSKHIVKASLGRDGGAREGVSQREHPKAGIRAPYRMPRVKEPKARGASRAHSGRTRSTKTQVEADRPKRDEGGPSIECRSSSHKKEHPVGPRGSANPGERRRARRGPPNRAWVKRLPAAGKRHRVLDQPLFPKGRPVV